MGLKDKNNPLGQRVPSDHLGTDNPAFQHGQSAELVDQIRRKAAQNRDKKNPKTASNDEYDIQGPDRQPGKIVRQSKLGQQRRKNQEGQYTQDNQEEGSKV